MHPVAPWRAWRRRSALDRALAIRVAAVQARIATALPFDPIVSVKSPAR